MSGELPWYEDARILILAAGTVVNLGWNLFNSWQTRRIKQKESSVDFRTKEFQDNIRAPIEKCLNDFADLTDKLHPIQQVRDANERRSAVETLQKEHFEPAQRKLTRAIHAAVDVEYIDGAPWAWEIIVEDAWDIILEQFNVLSEADSEGEIAAAVDRVDGAVRSLSKKLRRNLYQQAKRIKSLPPQ